MVDWERVEKLRSKGKDWNFIAKDKKASFTPPEGIDDAGKALEALFYSHEPLSLGPHVVDPDPELEGKTVFLGKTDREIDLVMLGVGAFLALIFGVPAALVIWASGGVGPFYPFWFCFLLVAALISVPSIWATAWGGAATLNGPWNISLSPEGIRAGWWLRSRRYPWSAIRGVRRTVGGAKMRVATWHFEYEIPGSANRGDLTINDALAPAVLRYPACPRLPLTAAEMKIVNSPKPVSLLL
jgi:hypothetical protein